MGLHARKVMVKKLTAKNDKAIVSLKNEPQPGYRDIFVVLPDNQDNHLVFIGNKKDSGIKRNFFMKSFTPQQ